MTEFGVQGSYVTAWTDPQYMPSLVSLNPRWVRLAIRRADNADFWNYCAALKAAGIKILGTMGSSMKGSAYTSLADWTAVVNSVMPKCIGVIDILELWNEPEDPQFRTSWYPPGNSADNSNFASVEIEYVDMLKAVYNAANRRIPVYAGAVTAIAGPSTWGLTLLTYVHNNADAFTDGYSIHVYHYFVGETSGNLTRIYNDIKTLVGKPVVVSETGEYPDISEASGNKFMDLWFPELIAVGCPFVIWYAFWDGWTNDLQGLFSVNWAEKTTTVTFRRYSSDVTLPYHDSFASLEKWSIINGTWSVG